MNKLSTTIIAEAGVNHNGSIDIAKEMIDAAANAGVDYVKFQTFKAETLVTQIAQKAEYQKNVTNKKESQYDMIKKLELDISAHKELIEYSKSKDIQFLSTAFDRDSIDMLTELDIPLFKIPSGEITNLPYLRHIGCMRKPIILSTGMAILEEIGDALEVLLNQGLEKKMITVLHCNTAYPTPMKDVNLNAMLTIKDELGVKVGYSDHTLGIEVPIAAVALGAVVIEKHFTLDRNFQGPDHAASLEPNELKDMVIAIRNIEKALGSGEKSLTKSELENLNIARKSIVAIKKISKGDLLTKNNIGIKRPGNGISPMKWDGVIGTVAQKNYVLDDFI